MNRRRYQRGQLYKDGNNWLARWREDVISNGTIKRVQRHRVLGTLLEYPTKRLALKALEDRMREINSGDYKPLQLGTFADFAKRWQDNVMCHHKPSTQRSEKSVIQTHLVPAFGMLPPTAIGAEMLQQYVSALTASPKTIRNIIVTLRTMWVQVKTWGYAKHDPFEGLKLPTVVKGNVYFFTPEEAMAIIGKAQEPWKTFFRILAETGIRPGEIAGLPVEDFDQVNRVIRIRQSVWQRQVQTPKSDAAVRSFPISRGLADALIAVIGKRGEGLIFTAESGRPLSMDNFRQRVLGPILDSLGIRNKAAGKRVGNYAFRHMNATLMDGLGVALKTRQSRLGHAQIETTLTHYTHHVEEQDRQVAEQIGALLSPRTVEAVQ